VCCCSCLLQSSLFIYSYVRDCLSPSFQHSGHPTLFATCFCCYCLLFRFFFPFFPWWGSVCPGAMLI
jgi:hypothetical protein